MYGTDLCSMVSTLVLSCITSVYSWMLWGPKWRVWSAIVKRAPICKGGTVSVKHSKHSKSLMLVLQQRIDSHSGSAQDQQVWWGHDVLDWSSLPWCSQVSWAKTRLDVCSYVSVFLTTASFDVHLGCVCDVVLGSHAYSCANLGRLSAALPRKSPSGMRMQAVLMLTCNIRTCSGDSWMIHPNHVNQAALQVTYKRKRTSFDLIFALSYGNHHFVIHESYEYKTLPVHPSLARCASCAWRCDSKGARACLGREWTSQERAWQAQLSPGWGWYCPFCTHPLSLQKYAEVLSKDGHCVGSIQYCSWLIPTPRKDSGLIWAFCFHGYPDLCYTSSSSIRPLKSMKMIYCFCAMASTVPTNNSGSATHRNN